MGAHCELHICNHASPARVLCDMHCYLQTIDHVESPCLHQSLLQLHSCHSCVTVLSVSTLALFVAGLWHDTSAQAVASN